MITLRRIGLSVVTACVLLVVGASPAAAHTVSGQGATNYRSTGGAVSPAVPGLTVKVVNLGSDLQVTWTGPIDLIVEGYQHEPYLRVGPDGVFRNRLSPATYLNAIRTSGAVVPPFADATAPPQWERLSGGRTVRWHDHRIHWMGGPTPPQVARAPGSFHHVFTWNVAMRDGSIPIAATGSLDWVPGPSPWPWLGLIVVLAAAGIVAGTSRRWASVLLGLVALLVVADVFHAVGSGLEVAGTVGHKLVFIFAGSYYSVIAWILGAVAIRFLARRSVDGLFAAVFTALVIGLFGGLADVVALARSQVPYAWGPVPDRILVAASIGVGAGVVVGSILAYRANRPEPVFEADVPSDASLAGG